ncbi:hypothetical protein M8J76_007090 [Diaphorina citri]|nr:hypothetical protein M8J76_007090 [Diaphorina citri]
MPQQEIPSQRCMARALYDNVAEAPDELVFRKGDLLTVLEQNTSGIEGWWLCVLRGRQGICPGNRLKIVAGMYANESNEAVSNDFNTLQKQGKRRSWNIQPNKVMTPHKVGDVFLYDVSAMQKYDVPRSQNWTTPHSSSVVESSYDVPPHPIPVQLDYANLPSHTANTSFPHNSSFLDTYDVPQTRPVTSGDAYDIPRPLLDTSTSRHQSQGRLSPSSSISSLTTNSDSVSSSSASNRSSSFMSEYDVPRSSSKVLMSQSFPTHVSSPRPPHHQDSLPVDLQDARDHLQRAETEVVSSINKLISFASPEWRNRDSLEPRLGDIRNATRQLQVSLHEFTIFTQRCLGNAMKCEDKSLYAKLNTLVNCLLDSDRIIHEACRSLSDQGWDINRLVRNPGEKVQPDSLDQLIVICIKSLLDHVKHISTFIQGNSPLLFKRPATASDSEPPNTSDLGSGSLGFTSDDYVKAEHPGATVALLTGEEGTYEMLTNRDDVPAMDRFNLGGEDGGGQRTQGSGGYADKQAILFYAAQVASLSHQLTTAIDLFLQTVEHNQPPKVFLCHSKLVLLCAYRLVYTGDTVSKNVSERCDMKTKLAQCCNVLCETLGTTVHKTRKAALQFPSVTAVQEMVDSVVDISHVARDLKIGIVMCAQQA